MRNFTLLSVWCLLTWPSWMLAKNYEANIPYPIDTIAMTEDPIPLDIEKLLTNGLKPGRPLFCCPTVQSHNDVCGQSVGWIDLTPDPNSQGPWLYMWSNGETTQDILNLPAGQYSVTIFDANMNFQIAQAVIQASPPIVPQSITGTVTGNTICGGQGNGAIDATIFPNLPGFSFLWSNGATTLDISNLDAGPYTLTVTYGVTCTATASFVVPNLTNAPVLAQVFPTFDACEQGNGTASALAVGGAQPYSYSWSTGGTTQMITNLSAGVYTVTVSGADGCTNSGTVEVKSTTYQVNVDANQIVANTTCNGANGSLSISVTPAGPSYTFLWSNGATTQNLTNVPSGSYRVTVTRAGTCTATDVWYVENEPILPGLAFNNTNASCGKSNGTVDLTILPGAVAPFTYHWSTGATTQDLMNVPPGTYDLTITSANGCTSTGSTTIDDVPIQFGYSAQVTDNTSCDTINGKIVLSLFPANLTYSWSNGATSKTLTSLAPGSYTVTVSAGGTCTQVETYLVGDLREYPSIPLTPTPSHCSLANGAIDLTVHGQATTPLSYQWSNGATTQDLSGIKADTFFVTVTSAVGCSAQNQVIVTNINDTLHVAANLADNVSCAGPTGSIALHVTPVDTNYVYLWSNSATTDSLSNLAGGTYLVTVTLGISCIALDTFTVNSTALPPGLSSTGVAAICGQPNGSADLTLSGGVGPFTYAWSNTATTEDLSSLPPGTYTVTVTGSNACTATTEATVADSPLGLSVNGSATANASCSVNNGSIDVGITPSGTYNYVWSNTATTEDLSGLAPGTYTVTVSLGNCLSSNTFTVTDNALAPGLSSAGAAATCGQANGSADLTLSGGVGPFTYTWSNTATTEDLSGILPGTYTVTVTGSNACSSTTIATIADNPIALNVNGATFANTSCAVSDGSINVGITPAGTYAYVWSNTATTEDLIGIAPGTYTVTVTLGNCVSSNTFTVADNAISPNLSGAGTASVCGQSNGSIDLTTTSGAGPFNYLWSNTAATEDISGLTAGTYTVTVTGSNACSATTQVTVASNSIALNVGATPAPNTNCINSDGAIDISVTPAGAYTYAWSNSATSEDIAGLASGLFTVTVSFGTCQSSSTFSVGDITQAPNLSSNITASICGASNGAIDLIASGPAGNYTYFWSNTATTQDISSLLPGTYSVTVTAANGCSSTTALNVANNASTFSLSAAAADLTDCAANNGSINLSISTAGNYTYNWSNGATTEDLSSLPAGTYTVSVTESGSCTATATYFVTDQRSNPLTTQSVTAELCGLSNGAVDLSVNGGTTPYIYTWTGGQTTQDLSTLGAGTYTVTVTDVNHCTATAEAIVPGNSITFNLSGTPTANASCIQQTGSVDLVVTPAGAYTYQWSNMATTQDLSTLGGGTYTVTVSAGGNCTNTISFVVTSNVPQPQLSPNITAGFCGGAVGAIDLTVGGGSPSPYTYQWSNQATTEDLNGILSGSYTVTVTAANGCSSTDQYTVPENVFVPAIASQLTAATSCVANNGAIDLTVTPAANGPYTFNWSNNAQTEDLQNIAAGVYTVTVSAGGACTNTASLTVNSNTGMVALSGQPVSILCFGDQTGSIDLSVTTGTAPFTYNWSPNIPGNPQDPSGLASGTYTVTVTDNLGCTSSSTFNLSQPASALQLNCAAVDPVSQPGSNDGSGSVNISGGTGPYTVSWSPGGTQNAVPAGNFPISNLAENSYGVTVTDANGCPSTCGFSVVQANCITAVGTMNNSLITQCGSTCVTAVYNSNGQVLANNDAIQFVLHQGSGNTIVGEIARNSQPTFCFDAATMSYGTTYYISAIAGNTDANGDVLLGSFCSVASFGTPVKFFASPVASANAPGPINCKNLQASLLGASDQPGSTFQWSTQNGTIVGNAAQAGITVSAGGDYTLIVNSNSCKDTLQVNVAANLTQPQVTVNSASTALDCATTSLTLNGTITGSANATSGWFNASGAPLGAGATLQVNTAGQYFYAAVDPGSFCADTASLNISQNINPPTLSIATPAVLTCLTPAQTLAGSSGASGVQFSWATISGTDTTIVGNSANLSVNTAGTYHLFGFNPANHCSNAVSVNVTANLAPPTADAGLPFTLDCAGETAPLDGSGSGGAANLAYQWSSNNGHFVSGANTASPLVDKAGTYTLVVTNNANGCTDSDEVTIDPEVPLAFASVQQPTCQGAKGIVEIDSVTGLSEPILYSLDGSQPGSQGQFGNLDPGIYTLTVSGGNGCSATTTVTVETPAQIDITLDPTAQIALGHSIQITAGLNLNPSDIASILWTPATGLDCDTCLTPTATPTNNTEYALVVVSKVGCSATARLLITVDKKKHIYAPNIFSPNGDGKNDVFTLQADPLQVLRIKSLQVFSRWGEEVYERKDFSPVDAQTGWDGTFKGSDLNPAVFIWQAVVEFADGQEDIYTGDVTLKR